MLAFGGAGTFGVHQIGSSDMHGARAKKLRQLKPLNPPPPQKISLLSMELVDPAVAALDVDGRLAFGGAGGFGVHQTGSGDMNGAQHSRQQRN